MTHCSWVKSARVPADLYKYVSVKRALEILLNQEIYFAHRSQFNDPLDGTFSHAKGEDVPGTNKRVKYLESCQKKLDQVNLGFFSMSKKYNSYPMWAHYADQHQGCCLGFDFSSIKSAHNWEECFPFVFVRKVDYPNKLPTLDDTKKVTPHDKGSIYMTKFAHWRYEQEWRAVMYDGKYNPSGKEAFKSEYYSFQNRMKGSRTYKIEKNFIKRIILGNRMRDSDKKTIIATAKIYGIDVYDIFPMKHKVDMQITRRKD